MVWVTTNNPKYCLNEQNCLNDRDAKQQSRNLMRLVGIGFLCLAMLVLTGCSSTKLNKYGVKTSKRVYTSKGSLPKKAGSYKVGKPYKVAGKYYYPREDKNYNKTGKASWYGDEFHGRKTANGEIFDMHALTAAHKTLPLPSLVKVTNLENGKTIIVRVNDRGPYHNNRLIDLSRAAATKLGYQGKGLANVRVQYFGKAAKHPNGDNAKIAALGGKSNGGGFFSNLFGWNQPKFVAEKPSKTNNVKLAKSSKSKHGKLKASDMQEFDPDIGAAIGSSVRLSTASNSSYKKINTSRLTTSDATGSGSGDFVQVAMFKNIKQAVEYKRQLGTDVFSKIDIKQVNSSRVYLVMVES